jgi:hypothetical protein
MPCAKVLHTTGSAKEVEKLIEDWTETQVLFEDGSNADLLTHALTMVQPRAHWTGADMEPLEERR